MTLEPAPEHAGGTAHGGFDSTVQLVVASQGGDPRALNELFARYLPRTRRIVACRMGWKLKQLVEQEDLVQAAMLRIFQGLERFEVRTEGSFRHWVAHTVECTLRNAARDSRRAKRGGGAVKRWSEIADDSLANLTLAGDAPTPSAVVQAVEAEEKIEAALLQLPERYREAIVLRSLCGMSFEEVASQLGIEKEATARQIYSRGLQKLKDQLGA